MDTEDMGADGGTLADVKSAGLFCRIFFLLRCSFQLKESSIGSSEQEEVSWENGKGN